jgi:ribosomal protein S18 acetylase RimI-like enzyme
VEFAHVITVRAGTTADQDFVIQTASRLAAFGPPPWRTAQEVVAGEVRCLVDFFARRMAGSTLVVAEEDGCAAGFAFFEHATDYFTREHHGHLGMIAVGESSEGRGVGTALLRAAEEWTRAQGYGKLTLNVFEGNERARSIYERAGYAVETLRYVKMLR